MGQDWPKGNPNKGDDGCFSALFLLPFFVIGMLVRVMLGEGTLGGSRAKDDCGSYARSSALVGLAVLSLPLGLVVGLGVYLYG